MAIFYAIRTPQGLVPDGVESSAEFSKIPFGKPVRVEVRQQRNIGHHRLYWAMVQRIASAVGAEPENISDMLKISTGHCMTVHSKTLGTVRLPRSISFAKMDQTQFHDFFERCVQTIYTEWGIGRDDILSAVSDLLMPGEYAA